MDEATDPWGIDVSYIKMQDIELPADMKRVMAKQAEAERERRAVMIQAEGEYSAAEKLSLAAEVLSSKPGGLSVRTLQTIEKINPDPSKTVLFALPIEFFEGMKTLTDYFKGKKKLAFIATAADLYSDKSFVDNDRQALVNKGLEVL